MLQTLRNAWSIPELRKKIIFTLFILLIYRVGNVIPVPSSMSLPWQTTLTAFCLPPSLV